MKNKLSEYDVIIVGAGPCGLYAAYKIINEKPKAQVLILDMGNEVSKRKCPAIQKKTKCMKCKTCSIMSGVGGAGAFSDGKFPITNDFGGFLWEKVGKEKSLELQREVDYLNYGLYCVANKMVPGTEEGNKDSETGMVKKGFPKLYKSSETPYKKICTQHNLHLLDADIRHLGTDLGQVIYSELYKQLVHFGVHFETNMRVDSIQYFPGDTPDSVVWCANTYHTQKVDGIENKEEQYCADNIVIATGRSGSEFVKKICEKLDFATSSNKVDIGIRFECPDEIWSHITKDLYESKIVYKTKLYEDEVRTFCMNPSGEVVTENTNGLITVNGHAFEDKNKKTNNTNFALLVSQTFTEPFNDSSEYGNAIVKLSNMLGGGVIVQRYGDLVRGKRSTRDRMKHNTVIPTLNAEPGDLSWILPKRILDDILEMIEKLDHLVPGMMNDDNLLYGVEVKHYNNTVNLDNHFEPKNSGLGGIYFGGDGSGWTHSLSQASASGLAIGEEIIKRL